MHDLRVLLSEEGDVRLVEQSTVSNWVQGRLEVFFEGSWSQVCADDFDGTDATVACRQLGFTAGTGLSSELLSLDYAETLADPLVYPEVAVTSLGCNGTEARLLDCPGEMEPMREVGASTNACFVERGPGLHIACVAKVDEGAAGVFACR